jgi:hypothetical protein
MCADTNPASLKYSLSTVSQYVGINEQSGVLTVTGELDAETINSITLIAIASDGVNHAQVCVSTFCLLFHVLYTLNMYRCP